MNGLKNKQKKMNKNVSIIGIGKLGICFGLNLKKAGWEVIGIDNNQEYVNQLNLGTFKSDEEGVNDYLKNHPLDLYSTDIEKAIESDIIFIVVPTPSTADHKYDHSYIEKIKNQLISLGLQKSRKDLIINCTTFPGYCDQLQKELEELNYKVSYNPEFIAQGTIIRDQLYCDNVLIGEHDVEAGNKICEVYKTFVLSEPIYNRMSRTEAEIAKLSVNCFLTTKISFANMIGDIASKYDCSGKKILAAIGTDSRIGTKYLMPGFGYGGPCFPRDNRALARCAEDVGISAEISKATDRMNKLHLEYQIEDTIRKNNKQTDLIEIEYLTYKKESVSLEESQQLEYAKRLNELGYKLKINDKRQDVMDVVAKIFGIESE